MSNDVQVRRIIILVFGLFVFTPDSVISTLVLKSDLKVLRF